MLNSRQSAALRQVECYARTRKEQAGEYLRHILEMSDIEWSRFERSVNKFKQRARVCLHFHPDRLTRNGEIVARSLLQSGEYWSQFVTGISAGSVSATPGGARYRWEEKLFRGAYEEELERGEERPKYGSLYLFPDPDGSSPRFGSCYLVLRPEVTERCTFTYGDSHREPKERGTLRAFEDILCALFGDVFERESALGHHPVSVEDMVKQFEEYPETLSLRETPGRNLDHYIEAQVHGPVRLGEDVEHLVVDCSFQGTEVGAILERVAKGTGGGLIWTPGFRLSSAEAPRNFRGPVMPKLAGEIGTVSAQTLGQACLEADRDPDSRWAEYGSQAHLKQLFKRLWHVMVKFGRWGE